MNSGKGIKVEALSGDRDGGIAERARFGVIVLATDQTIEVEYAQLQLPGCAWHYARIPMATTTSAATLTSMHGDIAATAALFPRDFDLKAIGYACTSASTLIGDDQVAEQIHKSHPKMACSNPIQAGVAGLRQLGAARIALVTPYVEEVTAEMALHFQQQGLAVNRVGSFMEPIESQVPRIQPRSIAAAALALGEDPATDAVFIACTSLRTFDLIRSLEDQLGKPVVTSNQAMAWHMARLSGIDDEQASLGALWRCRI